MQSNNLKHLGSDAFKLGNLATLTHLRLDGNALSCDCQLSWLFKRNISGIESSTCYSPEKLKGKSINAIVLNDLKCGINDEIEDLEDVNVGSVLDSNHHHSEDVEQASSSFPLEAIEVFQKLGSSLVLNCSELMVATWWKNQRKLSLTDESTSHYELSKGSLMIKSLLSSDRGNFVCVKDDHIVASYKVQVLGKFREQ